MDAYRIMFASRRVDDREILLKRQQKSSSRSPAPAMKPSASPPAFALKSGYDWFYPYYRDRALCLGAGRHSLRNAAAGSRRGRRSLFRWTPDAFPLGVQAIQYRHPVSRHRQPDPAGGRLRGSGPLFCQHPDSAAKRMAIIASSKMSNFKAMNSPMFRSVMAPPARANSGRL